MFSILARAYVYVYIELYGPCIQFIFTCGEKVNVLLGSLACLVILLFLCVDISNIFHASDLLLV